MSPAHSNSTDSDPESPAQAPESRQSKYNVRLPFFVDDEQIGLGDVVRRVTYAVGIKDCSGCADRAATLNRWLSFRR
jgi:hypothetical protein